MVVNTKRKYGGYRKTRKMRGGSGSNSDKKNKDKKTSGIRRVAGQAPARKPLKNKKKSELIGKFGPGAAAVVAAAAATPRNPPSPGPRSTPTRAFTFTGTGTPQQPYQESSRGRSLPPDAGIGTYTSSGTPEPESSNAPTKAAAALLVDTAPIQNYVRIIKRVSENTEEKELIQFISGLIEKDKDRVIGQLNHISTLEAKQESGSCKLKVVGRAGEMTKRFESAGGISYIVHFILNNRSVALIKYGLTELARVIICLLSQCVGAFVDMPTAFTFARDMILQLFGGAPPALQGALTVMVLGMLIKSNKVIRDMATDQYEKIQTAAELFALGASRQVNNVIRITREIVDMLRGAGVDTGQYIIRTTSGQMFIDAVGWVDDAIAGAHGAVSGVAPLPSQAINAFGNAIKADFDCDEASLKNAINNLKVMYVKNAKEYATEVANARSAIAYIKRTLEHPIDIQRHLMHNDKTGAELKRAVDILNKHGVGSGAAAAATLGGGGKKTRRKRRKSKRKSKRKKSRGGYKHKKTKSKKQRRRRN